MKKRIFVIVVALLLCVSASFAWLSNREEQPVSNIDVGFDNPVSVAKLDFTAIMEVEKDPGVFTPLGKGESFSFSKKDLIPDSVTRFKIKIMNNSEEASEAKLAVAITLDPEQVKTANILDVLYIDVMAVDGLSGTNDYHIFAGLKDAEEVGSVGGGSYLFYVYGDGSELPVPPSTEVTLDCYFYYSQEATAKYQNKDISLSFRIE